MLVCLTNFENMLVPGINETATARKELVNLTLSSGLK